MTRARHCCRIGRCEGGAAAVEFALIGLVLIALLLGIVEFGRALFVRNQLAFAADIAVRQILIDPMVTDSRLETAIGDTITFGQAELQLELGTEAVDGTSFRTISLSQPMTLLVPYLNGEGIVLSVHRRVPLL